jgi:predicted transcriptional regulator
MIAELLREDILSIEKNDALSQGQEIMNTNEISEIAVTDKNVLQFLLREIDLIDVQSLKASSLTIEKENIFVFEDDHVFQAMIKMNNNDLSMIPVVNREMDYKGVLTKRNVIDYICDSHSIGGEGSIIILEETFRDYSLTNISNIIEQEGGKVIGLFITSVDQQSEKLWISLKLNTLIISNIIAALERREYNVIAQISGEHGENMIKERYESLMTFLNI